MRKYLGILEAKRDGYCEKRGLDLGL